MTYLKLPSICLLLCAFLFVNCNDSGLSISEDTAEVISPVDPTLESYARAQVALHNEMILSGPIAMKKFFARYSESDFAKNGVNFAKALDETFHIQPSTFQNLEAAFIPLQHLSNEELHAKSIQEIKRLAINGEIEILHHQSFRQDQDGPDDDCNCGQDVFDGIVLTATATVACAACFSGGLPACLGCAWSAGSAYGKIKNAWDCGCFSQDLSPYQ